MSQPTVKKVEETESTDNQPLVEEKPPQVVKEKSEKQIKQSGKTVSKPHVAQTTKRSSLKHYGVVSGKKYIFPSSRGRSEDAYRWVAVLPEDAEKYRFMAKNNHDWHFTEKEVPLTREAHYVTFNGTEGSSVTDIDFPMYDHNKKDPNKRDRIYHFKAGETIEIAKEDAKRFEAKAHGTKTWTYTKKTVPVGGS